MTCTCTTEHTGELLPTGCTEHPGENMRMDHRHGEAWHMSEEGAIGELEYRDWKPFAWSALAFAALWAGAWLVWG